MNIAVVFISPDGKNHYEYLKNFGISNLTILQIGRSEIFRELGRVFVILDIANGALIARQFFSNVEKIENLIICGPLNFLKEAEKHFSQPTDKTYFYPEK